VSIDIKQICCIGAGYVGGPTMAVIADNCHHIQVNVVDINKTRITNWNNDDFSKLPVYEPGLAEIVKRRRGINLHFSCDVNHNISIADMIFISVNTPTKLKGIGAGQASDLKWIEESARQISKYSKGETIVVEKSTLPVKTAETIKLILNGSKDKSDGKKFHVISNPEFLAEGSAIDDLSHPDRVLIGGENDQAIKALENIYLNWINKEKILTTNLWSSELSKLTANAFLAQRISSINSISALCEVTGANINEVAIAIGMDHRIGSKFLKVGPGFGGSCFKKDILNLVYLCRYYNLNEVADYWQKVIDINFWQQKRITHKLVKKLFGTISGKKIGILGFAFKANTNDTRESPAIQICKDLIIEGAELRIYDPKVNNLQIEKELDFKESFTNHLSTTANLYEACLDADAILIMTEWEEFKRLDFTKISTMMRKPSWVLDTRNIIDRKKAKDAGLNVWNVGVDY
tara:strand:- start:2659 stop:4044 length:1386 start_codon:yes stop_codon:yes gene_type:complete